jgi:hypothetical protein
MVCSAPVSKGGHNPGSNPMMGLIATRNERRDVIVADFTIRKPRKSRRCACRKLNPGILVMHSAQDWATKNVRAAHDRLGVTGA